MKDRKNISIVFLKNENDGSSYYRLYQYIKNVRIINMTPSRIYKSYYKSKTSSNKFNKLLMGIITLMNVSLAILLDGLIWKSGTIIINRRFFPRSCPKIAAFFLEKYFLEKKVYWDFDDNIIEDGEISKREAALLERKAACIVVTNEHLANTISPEYRNKVKLLPTTDCEFEHINIEEYIKKRRESFGKTLEICWVGTRDNIKYLENILPAIESAAKYCNKVLNKKIILRVVANGGLDSQNIDESLRVENIAWTREEAANIMKKSHVGLMPLTDSDYNRGKGGFKAIQYMSAGVIPLLSEVGYNVNVVIDGESGFFCKDYDEWGKSIIKISENIENWERMARNARLRWENNFSPGVQREFWNQVVKEDI